MTLRALYDVPAPAKLNLFLHVVGRRADGYHLLQSLFVLIDWADTLHFESRDDGATCTRHDLGPALPADDLCLRAARALQAASGTPLGADISILKRVPWGAGMGGGSSDAASTLLALNRLWATATGRAHACTSSACGSAPTCPSSSAASNAFVEGIGERLTPLALPPARYRGRQAAGGDRHARHLRAPGARPRHRSCYTCGLSSTRRGASVRRPGGRRVSAPTTCSRPPRTGAPRWRKPPAGSRHVTATAA